LKKLILYQMKAISYFSKSTIWFNALIAFLTCLIFLILPSCQNDELNQDSILDLDLMSSPALSKNNNLIFGKLKDVDGNIYKTVKIGKQWWMAENLAYLPAVSPPTEESVTDPYYYVYDYIGTTVADAKASVNYKTYGVLYNWSAAMNACPKGWHIPSDAEWSVLSDYLINNGFGYEGSVNDISKSLAAQTNWQNSGTPGTPGNDQASNNSSGFSGLPDGWRYWTDNGTPGGFMHINLLGAWWSSTYGEESSTTDAWIRYITSYETTFGRQRCAITFGMSVRCVKD
jgi:uncharacterized protein (TIGR02145 family)